MSVKLLLQFLIGVVDTELFEGVFSEMLETINIEDTDKTVCVGKNIFAGKTGIDGVH